MGCQLNLTVLLRVFGLKVSGEMNKENYRTCLNRAGDAFQKQITDISKDCEMLMLMGGLSNILTHVQTKSAK